LVDNDDGTFFKRSRSFQKKVIEAFNDSSSYTAVPVRATIISCELPGQRPVFNNTSLPLGLAFGPQRPVFNNMSLSLGVTFGFQRPVFNNMSLPLEVNLAPRG
jgi:hypothetical protein